MKANEQFTAQIRTFEKSAKTRGTNPDEYGREVMNTAKMLTLCVLKKLSATGGHTKIINDLRRGVMSGEGDGCDLVQRAALALIESVNDAENTFGQNLPDNWTEAMFTEKHLDKRVLIRSDDSAKWKDVETCYIRKVFRAIRDEVRQSASVQLASQTYSYIADLATNDEGEEEVLYKRLPKYHTSIDEGGEVSPELSADIDSYVQHFSNSLTHKQRAILALRLSGYGQKAIASKLGVSRQAIQCHMKAIQKAFTDYMNRV